MSEDKKLIVLKTKQKEDSSVEDMVDDCVQLNKNNLTSSNILATTNLMKNSRDLIGMLEEVKLFLFRNNYE